MSKTKNERGTSRRLGKTERPPGNPRGDGKDKENDEEGKESYAWILEGTDEAGGFRKG